MVDPRDRDSRLFRLLVRLLPADFRSEFGADMRRVFGAERRDAIRGGRLALAALWWRTAASMVVAAARQHVDALGQDLAYALRTLRRTPVVSGIAVVSLAIGIGANTAVFGLLNALLLGTARTAVPSELVGVYATTEGRTLSEGLTSADLEAVRNRATTVADVAGSGSTWTWLTGDRVEPAELLAQSVSPRFFSVLGLRAALGRLLDEADADHPSVVLAYHVWQGRFGGDPGVLGRAITLNQRPFTIAGVAPDGFTGLYPGQPRDLWLPAGASGHSTSGSGLDLVARLAPGRTVTDAQAEIAVIVSAAHTADGVMPDPVDPHAPSVLVSPLRGVHPAIERQVMQAPLLLAGVVAFLLLIACANLAALLLARGASRRDEMAVRVSLGARRERLVRQLLTESLVLAAAGAVLGLLVAFWATTAIERHFAYLFDRLDLALDPRVLAFTMAASMASAFAFGLVPALDASRIAPFGSLRAQPRLTRPSATRTAFLVGQVALSVVLLVGALLMLQSVGHLVNRPGYRQDEIAHYRLRPSRLRYDAARADAYYRALATELLQVPGVRAVFYASVPPVRGWGQMADVSATSTAAAHVNSLRNEVSPGYFRELGIAIARGREFEAADGPGSAPVAVVNRTLASRLWSDGDPLGQEVRLDGRTHTVVGVVDDVYAARDGEPPLACVFLSHAQQRAVDARLLVRVDGRADTMVATLRRHILAVDPNVHVGQEMTLRQRTSLSFEFERLTARVLAGSGAVALLLTALGLFGGLSFWVNQRTREIGVRMSLGADTRAILRLVVGQGMAPVAVGLGAGLLVAGLATRLLASMLYGVSAHDPRVSAVSIALMCAVALVACALPAHRASRVDPAITLRE